MRFFFWTTYPFVQVGLAFIAGNALAFVCIDLSEHPYSPTVLWQPMLYSGLLLLLAALLLFHNYFSRSAGKGFLFSLLFALAGFLHFVLHDPRNESQHLSQFNSLNTQAVYGRVISEPEHKRGLLVFKLKATHLLFNKHWQSCTGVVSVSLADSNALLSYDQTVVLKGSCQKPAVPPTPYDFDYSQYLAYQGIYHTLYTRQFVVQQKRQPVWNFSLKHYSILARNALEHQLQKYLHESKTYALVSGLLIGKRSDFTYEDKLLFTNSGTIHILAVSGMHVVLIYQLIAFIALRLSVNLHSLLFNALVIVFIWFYIFMTGLQASACRAALMITFVLFSKIVNRENQTINSLFATAFFMLLYNPYYLSDVGFVLSFLAVAGILLTALVPKVTQGSSILHYVLNASVISIGAQLMTFPYSVHLFHQFPVYFLFANLILVPLSTLLLILSIILLFTSFIPYCSDVLVCLIDLTTQGMFFILQLLNQLPLHTVQRLSLSGWEMMILYAMILCSILLIIKKNIRQLWFLAGCIFLLSLSIHCRKIKAWDSYSLLISGTKENRQYLLANGRSALLVTSDSSARTTPATEAFLTAHFIENLSIRFVTPNQNFTLQQGMHRTHVFRQRPEEDSLRFLAPEKSERFILDYARKYSYLDPKKDHPVQGQQLVPLHGKKSFFITQPFYELDSNRSQR